MISKWQKLLFAVASVFLLSSSGGDFSSPEPLARLEPINEVNLHFFYSEYCTHCSEEKSFLDGIEDNYAYLNIIRYLTDSLLSEGGANPDYSRNIQLL